MKRRKALARLQELADVIKDRDLTTLRAHQRKKDAAMNERRAFEADMREERVALHGDFGYRASLEPQREAWRDDRRTTLLQSEVSEAATFEQARLKALRSTAQAKALDKLIDKLQSQETRAKERRS